MRFYSIEIRETEGAVVKLRYSSQNLDGTNNPACLRVNFDIPFSNASSPAGLAYIRIYGVPFDQLAQASNLNNNVIIIYGGMSAGLPLANPQQQGIILKGKIWSAFGNWQGNEVVLELIVTVADVDSTTVQNYSITWEKGQQLTDAVKQTLQIAYNAKPINIVGSFDPRLIATSTQIGTYQNLTQLGVIVKDASKAIINDINYNGANITQTNNGFVIYDNSTAYKPKKLSFTDFIGNATYTDYNMINFKLVLRGDLVVGDVITMPPKSNIANSRNSYTQFRDNLSFQNNFRISQLRHLADSRTNSSESWCTVVDAYVLTEAQTQ